MKLVDLCQALEQLSVPIKIDGDPDIVIHGVNTLQDAVAGEISFLSNPKYKHHLETTNASAVIVALQQAIPGNTTAVRCDDPYGVFSAAVEYIHGFRKHPFWGIDQNSTIAPSAVLGSNPNIAPYVTIGEHAKIGDNATIYPGCYVGDNVVIGDSVVLHPNIVIYDGTRLGNQVTLHGGCVVGEDGLGYQMANGRWNKIPQAGIVVVGDDVEMGANCCINRATVGETRIRSGTKFSDTVVIGHGCDVGENCMFVALTGLAGSVTVGNRVRMGGQSGAAGHISIGEDAVVWARALAWSDIPAGGSYMGNPAQSSFAYKRQVAASQRMPDIKRRLRQMESEIDELRQKLDQCNE